MPDTLTQVGATLLNIRLTLVDIGIHYGLQVLAAAVIMVIGVWMSRRAGRLLDAWLAKKALDVSLRD